MLTTLRATSSNKMSASFLLPLDELKGSYDGAELDLGERGRPALAVQLELLAGTTHGQISLGDEQSADSGAPASSPMIAAWSADAATSGQ